jgi:hypothetical protein
MESKSSMTTSTRPAVAALWLCSARFDRSAKATSAILEEARGIILKEMPIQDRPTVRSCEISLEKRARELSRGLADHLRPLEGEGVCFWGEEGSSIFASGAGRARADESTYGAASGE